MSINLNKINLKNSNQDNFTISTTNDNTIINFENQNSEKKPIQVNNLFVENSVNIKENIVNLECNVTGVQETLYSLFDIDQTQNTDYFCDDNNNFNTSSSGVSNNVVNVDLTPLENQISILENENNMLENNLSTLSSENILLESNLSTLQTNLSTIESKKDTLQNNLSTLESEKDTLQTNLSTLENEKDMLQSSLSTLETKNDTLQNSLSTLESKNDTLQTNLSTLENGKDTLQTNLSTLENEKDTLQTNLSTLENEKDTLQTNLSTLENNLSTLENNLSSLSSENFLLNSTLSILSSQNNIQNSTLSGLTSENAILNTKYNEIKTQYEQPLIITSKENLQDLINTYYKASDEPQTEASYRNNKLTSIFQPISEWDVSRIEDMSGLFEGNEFFNEDISSWNVVNVKDMSNMFQNASAFNKNISGWTVSKVTKFDDMFNGAKAFTQNINGWELNSTTPPTHTFFANSSGLDKEQIPLDFRSRFFRPATKDELVTEVNAYFNNNPPNYSRPIAEWDVSLITDMAELFKDKTQFNGDISRWDVSNVTNMSSLFRNNTAFNKDISKWNTSNVTNMEGMFWDAQYFNQPINTGTSDITRNGKTYIPWNISKVTDMNHMFNNAYRFNKPVDRWNVSKVKNMQGMFANNIIEDPVNSGNYLGFNHPLDSWDVSNVKNIIYMFYQNRSFNQPLNNWDVSNIWDMSHVFSGASAFDQDISNWNVSNVVMYENMFSGTAFNNNSNNKNAVINSWFPTYSIPNTTPHQIGGTLMQLNIYNSGFITATDTTKARIWKPADKDDLQTAINTFYKGESESEYNTNKNSENNTLPHISSWDVSGITDMSGLFQDNKFFNENIGSWNVSNVTNFDNMFNGAESFDQDLSCWFPEYTANQTISGYSLSGSLYVMNPSTTNFATGSPIENGISGKLPNFGNAKGWKPTWFQDLYEAVTAIYGGTESSYHYTRNKKVSTLPPINVWDVSDIHGMSILFRNKKQFNEDISKWDTRNVKNMKEMFNNSNYFNQPINTGTYSITRNGKTYIPWNISEATDMNHMFNNAYRFNQPLDRWNTNNVGNMSGMFENASAFNQNISDWTVSQVTNFDNFYTNSGFVYEHVPLLFRGVFIPTNENLKTEVDAYLSSNPYQRHPIGEWDVSNITDMSNLFKDKTTFNEDISEWTVSQVTNMSGMFQNASAFNQNISDWTVSQVTNFDDMFNGALAFTQNINGWELNSTTPLSHKFFANSSGLIKDHIPGAFKSRFFRPATKDELVTEVNAYFNNPPNYSPPIAEWDVSLITDMAELFQDKTQFNGDISRWDVSNVTNMSSLFRNNTAFNKDISEWNTSNVTNMEGMFRDAQYFNQPINTGTEPITRNGKTYYPWDVSNVWNMSHTFSGAYRFNKPVDRWNVSKVKNMQSMFANNIIEDPVNSGNYLGFNQPLDSWDLYNVTNISYMFDHNYGFEQDLSKWFPKYYIPDGINGTFVDIEIDSTDFATGSPLALFENTNKLPIFTNNLRTWRPASNQDLKDAINTFYKSDMDPQTQEDYNNKKTSEDNTLPPISFWDVSLITDMSQLFENNHYFNEDITGWDTSQVVDMNHMFNYAYRFNQPIDSWDVYKVTNMQGMFANNLIEDPVNSGNYLGFNQPLDSWDLYNVTNISYMFDHNYGFEQDLSKWFPEYYIPDGINGTFVDIEIDSTDFATGSPLFENTNKLPIFTNNLRTWRPASKQDLQTAINTFYKSDMDPQTQEDYNNKKTSEDNTLPPISFWDVSLITDMSQLFENNQYFNEDLSKWFFHNYSNPNGIDGAFVGIEINITDFATGSPLALSENTNKLPIFTNAQTWRPASKQDLQTAIIRFYKADVYPNTQKNYNTKKTSINKILPPINIWDVSLITDMSWLFENNHYFNEDIAGWNVSKVVDMNNMFGYAYRFNQNLPNWDVSSVTNFYRMFYNAHDFNGDISNWKINTNQTKTVYFYAMFDQAKSFNCGTAEFGIDTKTVTVNSITYTAWNVNRVNNMQAMFVGSAYNKSLANWDVKNVSTIASMFTISAFRQNISNWKSKLPNTVNYTYYDNGISSIDWPTNFRPVPPS